MNKPFNRNDTPPPDDGTIILVWNNFMQYWCEAYLSEGEYKRSFTYWMPQPPSPYNNEDKPDEQRRIDQGVAAVTHMLWAAWMLFVATIFYHEYKDLQVENKRLTFVYGGLVLRNHLFI